MESHHKMTTIQSRSIMLPLCINGFNDIQKIHDASVYILETEGVDFHNEKALEIFIRNGFRTKNGHVLIREKDIEKSLETAPGAFYIEARNPKQKIRVGGGRPVLIPTLGSPNVALDSGELRSATMDDFRICCDLVQTSGQIDMGGWLMVQPGDVPIEAAHLDMLLTYMLRCDKPIMGAFGDNTMARDTIEMARLILGDRGDLLDHPMAAFVVNALTPLQFSHEQSDVLLVAAKHRQPVIISNMALAGSTAPVQLPGLMALINAEILAGVALSQLVSPGTPVVYGTTSAPMDMKSSIGVVGAWETAKIAAMAIQMARFYNIPCRTGGSLTDAQIPDAQAAAESAHLLTTTMLGGADLILHACGQIASFMGMSFEKWLIDEEVCALTRQALAPLEISDETIDVETICSVGAGGQYLTHPTTFKHFKKLSRSDLFNRFNNSKWREKGGKDCVLMASEALEKRLSEYKIPPMDPGLKEELERYVSRRKAEAN